MNSAPNSKRSIWPIAIGSYFALAILGIITFVAWSTTHKMELVRTDYYEQEILFQKQIDARKRAAALGHEVAITLDQHQRFVKVRVPESHVRADLTGTVRLYRPSNAALDRVVRLELSPSGEQNIDAGHLLPGLWRVSLEWTANNTLYSYETAIIAGASL